MSQNDLVLSHSAPATGAVVYTALFLVVVVIVVGLSVRFLFVSLAVFVRHVCIIILMIVQLFSLIS